LGLPLVISRAPSLLHRARQALHPPYPKGGVTEIIACGQKERRQSLKHAVRQHARGFTIDTHRIPHKKQYKLAKKSGHFSDLHFLRARGQITRLSYQLQQLVQPNLVEGLGKATLLLHTFLSFFSCSYLHVPSETQVRCHLQCEPACLDGFFPSDAMTTASNPKYNMHTIFT